jgi:hypothetical protein
MPATLRRHGSLGDVLMDPTGGATSVRVASLNNWTLDLGREQVDVTAYGDPNRIYVQSLPDIKGTLGGWWEALASRVLFDAAMGDVPVTLKLVPSTLDATTFFTGLAYLSASIEVPADGAVSISGNFVAAAAWTLEPPAA